MKQYALVSFILITVFMSGCIQDGGLEIIALKSFDAVSDVRNPSILLNEEVEFRIEALPIINPNHVFRLFLPDGVEYLSGDFLLQNGELILEPSGQLGVNVKGEYLGKDAEKDLMKLDKTTYSFKVKGISEGLHRLIVETGSKDNIDRINPRQWGSISDFFIELRSATFCSAETLERAVNFCAQQEATCQTEQCIQDRAKQTATQL